VQDHGEKLYRRSLYTYWKRTLPPVNLAVFDAPNREVCSIGRASTNTPLQALVTLNDPQFVEAGRALGERLSKVSGDDDAKLAEGFLRSTGRKPVEQELSVLRGTLDRERKRYRSDPAAASALLATGEAPSDAKLDPVEHAAWAQTCSLLLNLSESLTRP
jgi:hypothetical protein